MRRTAFLWVIALLGAAYAFGGNHSGSPVIAAAPTPTPTPVAIAYDEINRMAFGAMTPPPVGAFPDDYARIMASVQSAPSAPAPKRPGGLAGMMEKAMHVPQNPGAMMNPMAAMQNGTLKRYTFYWVKGWIRIDDPVARTATIYKCREHQTIYLDLAHKTYRIENTDATPRPASFMPSSAARSNPYMQRAMEPGTALMHVTTTAKALGPKTVEAIATHGYASSNALTTTNATGSCRSGSFKSDTLEYVSNINKQGNYCPASAAPGARGASGYGVTGGCRPTMKVTRKGSVAPPPHKLAMYRRVRFEAGGGQGATTVLERGHVTWLYNPDIPPLFQIPSDFTKAG